MKIAGIEGNAIREIKKNSIKELIKSDGKVITKEREKKKFTDYFTFEKLQERIDKYNKVFLEEDIDIYLDIQGNNKNLFLRVMDKESDESIRVFNEEEIGEVLRKLDDLLGIIVDQFV